jgi:hypothetical protein
MLEISSFCPRIPSENWTGSCVVACKLRMYVLPLLHSFQNGEKDVRSFRVMTREHGVRNFFFDSTPTDRTTVYTATCWCRNALLEHSLQYAALCIQIIQLSAKIISKERLEILYFRLSLIHLSVRYMSTLNQESLFIVSAPSQRTVEGLTLLLLFSIRFSIIERVHTFMGYLKLKLNYDRQPVGQSVLVSGTYLGPATNSSFSLRFSLDSYGFVILWRPLWREDGSVIYCWCWSSPAQSRSSLSPAGPKTILYCPVLETPPTWRARSPYL